MSRFKQLFPFFFLYLSEGAPIGLIWWTLPALLKNNGVETSAIAAMSATIAIPWSLKFLLGPFVDLFCCSPKKLKLWILFTQIMMVVCLTPLVIDNINTMNIQTLTFALVLHAIFAAGQDVGIDTLAIKTVPKSMLGVVNGWMQGGMLTGRALIGGAGLWLALEFSPKLTIGLIVLILALASVVIVRFEVKGSELTSEHTSAIGYLKHLKQALKGSSFWFALLLAFIVGFSFEGIGIVASPLIRDMGFSNQVVSYFFGIATPVSLGIAAILGGQRIDFIGHKRGLTEALTGTTLFVLALITFLICDFRNLLIPGLIGVYFGIGWLTTGLYAYLMEISNKSLAAIQFSAFMAMTNLCETASGFFMSWGVTHINYAFSFLVLLSISWIGFILINKISSQQRKTA